jgi:hypothetical protein
MYQDYEYRCEEEYSTLLGSATGEFSVTMKCLVVSAGGAPYTDVDETSKIRGVTCTATSSVNSEDEEGQALLAEAASFKVWGSIIAASTSGK